MFHDGMRETDTFMCWGEKSTAPACTRNKRERIVYVIRQKVNVTMYPLNGRENNNKNCKISVSIVRVDAS